MYGTMRAQATIWQQKTTCFQVISNFYGNIREAVLADGVGFEPTRPYSGLPVFKTGAFNRSATHPGQRYNENLGYLSPLSAMFTGWLRPGARQKRGK